MSGLPVKDSTGERSRFARAYFENITDTLEPDDFASQLAALSSQLYEKWTHHGASVSDFWMSFHTFAHVLAHSPPKQQFLFPGVGEQPAVARDHEVAKLREHTSKLLLELERAKTSLIHMVREKRELQFAFKESRENIAHLRRQADGQLALIHQLISANRALQQSFLEQTADRLCLHESNEGIVVRVVDDTIVVRYDTSEGPLEQAYHKEQFVGKKLPDEGDRIEFHAFGWSRPHQSQGIERFLTGEEAKDVSDAFEKGSTGPLEI